MVVVVTSDDIDVHGDTGSLGEALQAVGQHLGAQVSNLLTTQLQVADTVRAVAEVDDGASEGLVEGCVGVAETGETGG